MSDPETKAERIARLRAKATKAEVSRKFTELGPKTPTEGQSSSSAVAAPQPAPPMQAPREEEQIAQEEEMMVQAPTASLQAGASSLGGGDSSFREAASSVSAAAIPAFGAGAGASAPDAAASSITAGASSLGAVPRSLSPPAGSGKKPAKKPAARMEKWITPVKSTPLYGAYDVPVQQKARAPVKYDPPQEWRQETVVGLKSVRGRKVTKIVTKKEKPKGSAKKAFENELIDEVLGFAPYEKRALELLRNQRDKRALKFLKKRIGNIQRAKQRRNKLSEIISRDRRH